jgi:carbamate kinase
MTVAASLAERNGLPVPRPGRIVVALGGNALLRRGEREDAALQRQTVDRAAQALAQLARNGHELVITHGNGPQIGLLALQQERPDAGARYPLDVLGAESEGLIGYQIEQALANALPRRQLATLLTQVVVDPNDPAFETPTKPIGPVYDEPDARRLATQRGWSVAPDGRWFRRVVASPKPLQVVETSTIRLLVDAGVIVICAGGGGIPVVRDAAGALRGVEAVIDKDRSAALLAADLGADTLLLLTDVSAVERHYGTPAAQPIARIAPDEIEALGLASGSMGPKAEACAWFVRQTSGRAAIGSLDEAAEVLSGRRGTTVVPPT